MSGGMAGTMGLGLPMGTGATVGLGSAMIRITYPVIRIDVIVNRNIRQRIL